MKRRFYLILLLALSLSLAGCNLLPGGAPATSTSTPAPSATPPAPTPVPATPTEPAPTTTLATYRNPEVGFELDYPADWSLTTTTPPPGPVMLDTVAYLYSHPQGTPPPKGGEGPVEGLKIDVIVIYDPSITQSLDQAVAWQKTGLSESQGQIVSEERQTLPSGLEAVRLHSTSPRGNGVVMMAKVGQAIILLGGSGTDLSRFDEVARTLRALPSPLPLRFVCALAYVEGSRLYCPGEGGTSIPIAEAGPDSTLSGPAISSDGAWVAYLVGLPNDTSQLWAVDVSTLTGNDGLGQPRRLLASNDQITWGGPDAIHSPYLYQWQPGTHTLFFNTRYTPTGGPVGPGDYTNADLWRVNADTGEVLNVLGRQSAGRFALSPDGRTIALVAPQSLGLMNADGTGVRFVLEYPLIITYSEYIYFPTPVWSPESAFFTVAVPSADPMAPDASVAIHRLGADGSVTTLATLPGNFVFGGQPGPDLAPDGQRVVFGRVPDPNVGMTDLHLINTDGSNDHVVTSRPSITGLGWSPDSSRYAYSLAPNGGGFVVSAQGAVQPFASGGEIYRLRWLDGESFYFFGTVNGQIGLYFQRLNEPERLIAPGVSDFDVRR